MIHIGSYQIQSLETGRFALDGGAMFGVVPKTLWSRATSCDEFNRIPLAMRVLLIRSADRIMLVDVGFGHKSGQKFETIYGVDHSRYTLESSLSECGMRPEEITDVILTHCHFDHMGGAVKREGDEFKLVFPDARHYVQQSHWRWALNPTERDRASFQREDIDTLRDGGRLTVIDGPCELFPGLHLSIANGHTPGLQMVKIQDSEQTLFYCSDLMPTAAHVPLPYIMGYDLNPLTTLEEKRRYLSQACDENWIIALEHDPNHAAIRVRRGKKGFELAEVVKL
ncbi:MAG: MBL fold metallo-hydrolase [Acidobacteriota bacterium]